MGRTLGPALSVRNQRGLIVGADAYLAARAQFVRADTDVTGLANKLSKVAGRLKDHRDMFSFSNTHVGFPAEVSLREHHFTEDGNAWPTAADINRTSGTAPR